LNVRDEILSLRSTNNAMAMIMPRIALLVRGEFMRARGQAGRLKSA